MPPEDSSCHVKIGRQGRFVIPVALRRELGFDEGDELIARVEDGRLVLESRANILKRWQDRLAAAYPPDVVLSDELIRERRLEAARELEGD